MFWRRGNYEDVVGRNEKKVFEYTKQQLQEEIADNQIGLKEFVARFAGKESMKA